MASLADIPSLDRSSRWSVVASTIDSWFPRPPSTPQPGFDPSDLAAAEHRLGVALPASLREWYLLFGKLAHVWNVQDRLIPPVELRTERGRIVIVRENQNVVQWSIEAAPHGESDPRVVVSDQADPSLLHLAASTLTEFALQFLVLNAKFSGRDDLFRANGQATDEGCTAFEQRLSRLPFADLHWPPFPTRIYGDDSILTEVDGQAWVWITARDAAAFERALQIAEDAGICWESLERPH